MTAEPTLIWFRQDLRLADNPALAAAVRAGGPVVPVFVWSPEEEGGWAPGGASRWWLHQSLERLAESLATKGSRLVIRQGPALEQLGKLARETSARRVFWNRRYEPAAIARDADIKARLRTDGLDAQSFNAALLHEPWEVRNKQGGPFQVFTPYWKSCLGMDPPASPEEAPAKIPAPPSWPKGRALAELKLEPKIDWAGGIRAAWTPGEAGAAAVLERFLTEDVQDYPDARDCPEPAGTSRISPYLHFGEIGPRQIWQAVSEKLAKAKPKVRSAGDAWLRQLGWREFGHHLLYHYPHTPSEPLRGNYAAFPWREAPHELTAWQRGRTGYPLVDAGMRELWTTGWMHNRVRMVAASFLVKHLLLPWQAGAAWFWDTLVDADLANNTMGWQWVAGSGADAAPYFRIFNPVSQGEKFDKAGAYVRRWVPELAELPVEHLQEPWSAPPEVLAKAGVKIGQTYPAPMVDHRAARERALAALATLRGK
jgi:deoxyribodipyrimidine photo-lyase